MIAIALASFKEAVRKKIILLIGLMTILYIIILFLITYFGFNSLKDGHTEESIILSNASFMVSLLGFYFSSMIIAFFTIMASLGAVSSELESGALHSVISKPLKRSHYVLGKYLGLAALTAAYSTFLYVVIISINHTLGVPPLDKLNFLVLLKGLALFILEPLTILALCIYGSVTFKTLNNGIVVIAIYILGTIGSMIEQMGSAMKLDGLMQWGIIISLISPFDVVYRKMLYVIYSSTNVSLFLSSPFFLSNNTPSNWMMIYVCTFLICLLLFSVRKFNKKDIS